ncbi:LicD family protein [Streptococcus acidominimus]|uniref:LicD family protein n=1 Tax=Streptococcus acidominimus TaxID=1326 RepID=A0A4Y9FLN1_STRAI|nr:LicD family protein [Streptococcus acidominimus]MBF0819542.1 LicD family protein [Streptococcus acidominimus]MBF0838877.1 LicD family protein [Streptococcus acidominimus]MBF0847575.1 LicD family protein [Streptococcus danieliae]TFU29752.1 LicD family protein [Streptococcus acidominimus]
MVELELQEVQRVALDLLIKFDKICKENSFRYSLGGGTLLGAIRHGGFIPWDDDIDIMMPRADYEKFLAYCQQHDCGFDCLSLNYTDHYFDLFSRISDRKTLLFDSSRELAYKVGVSIDIFPIDGLGNDDLETVKNFNKSRFKRELLVASKWKKYFRSKTRTIAFEPIRFTLFLMSRFVDKQQLCKSVDAICQQHDFETSHYAACISGVYREKEIMPISSFKEYQSVQFEGHDFDIISAYDAYLTQHYGNYMQLPPKEKQVTHHRAQYYWR